MMKTKRVMILAELKELQKSLMVCLGRAVKDNQADEKCCYHCSSLEHFIWQLPTHKDFQGKETVKWQGGDGFNEGSPDPSDNNQCHEEPPDGGSQGVKTTPQTALLESRPLSVLVQG